MGKVAPAGSFRSRQRIAKGDRDEITLTVLRIIDITWERQEDPIPMLLEEVPSWGSRKAARWWIKSNLQGTPALVRSTWARESTVGKNRRRGSLYKLTPRGEGMLRLLNKRDAEGSDACSKTQEPGRSYRETHQDLPIDLPVHEADLPGIRSSLEGYAVRFPILDRVPDRREMPAPWTEYLAENRPKTWTKWILAPTGMSWWAEKTTQAIVVHLRKIIGGHPAHVHDQAVLEVDRVATWISKRFKIRIGEGELIRRAGIPHREVLVPGLEYLLAHVPNRHVQIWTGPGLLTADASPPGPSIGADTLEEVEAILRSPAAIREISGRLDAYHALLEKIVRNAEVTAKAVAQISEIQSAEVIQKRIKR